MSEFVVIRLHAEDHTVEWVLADSNGTLRGRMATGNLEQAAVEIGERAVIVLVPALDVLTTTVNIPARSSARIRTALPFALEEDLADDVDELHFASGTKQENGRLPVAIVAREKMDAWLERLREAGIEPAIMTPVNHGVAKIPGTSSIVVDDQTIMFNDGGDTNFVMQNVKPSDVLVMAGQLGDDPLSEDAEEDRKASGHVVIFCTPEQDERLSHDWIALRHEMHSVDVNLLPDGVLPKLAVAVAAGHGVNLLQGNYGKKTEYAALLRPWRVAASLLLALAIVGVAMKGVAYNQLLDEQAALKAQFAAEYGQIRPDDNREVIDPEGMVDSLRRSLGTSSGPQVFLPSLRELGAALAANSAVKLESISYRAGVIDLRLTAPNVATLDSVQKAVSASGRFQASIQRTDQVADQIDGRIQIKEAGQ
jgi:general secretion pathway protein L